MPLRRSSSIAESISKFINTKHQNSLKKYERLLVALLGILVFAFYFLFNSQFNGPAYLGDGIGYLTKAAAIAGYELDAASSYHGGYSILLSPFVAMLTSPFMIWKALLAVNALLFAGSFILLYGLLKKLYPRRRLRVIFAVTVASALYPSWAVMSGYAFASSAFVFFFMLAAFVLSYAITGRRMLYPLFGLLIGFLYWIHPLGIAVAIASAVTLLPIFLTERRWGGTAAFLLPMVGMIILYSSAVHPWFIVSMTPEGFSATQHYSAISDGRSAVFSFRFLITTTLAVLGQFSYLLIASFGVAAAGLVTALRGVKEWRRPLEIVTKENAVQIFVVISILGVILAGAAMFSVTDSDGVRRIDHWIYGRYLDMVLLPLLGLGLLASWKRKYFVFTSVFLLVSAVVFYCFFQVFDVDSWNNIATITAFWPIATEWGDGFTTWFLAGAIVVAVAGLLGKRYIFLVSFPLLFLTFQYQFEWHRSLLSWHSKPSGLVAVIRDEIKPACIGFEEPEKGSYESQRLGMHTFYFYDLGMRRMTIEDWLMSDCGIYLAYSYDQIEDLEGVAVLGKEHHSSLYMFAKTNQVNMPNNTGLEDDYYLNKHYPKHDPCLVSGCE